MTKGRPKRQTPQVWLFLEDQTCLYHKSKIPDAPENEHIMLDYSSLGKMSLLGKLFIADYS